VPEHRVAITKIDVGRRLYGGWAYVAKDKAGAQKIDHGGDVVDDLSWPAMEASFVDYALESRGGDLDHTTFGASRMVEMFISTPERREALGIPDGVLPDRGVYVSYRADETPEGEALWQDVLKGKARLSIVGSGRREPIT